MSGDCTRTGLLLSTWLGCTICYQ